MTTKNIIFKLLVIFTLFLSACSSSPEIDNTTMLDGDQIFDPSLYNPAEYLVSAAITNPSTTQKNTPVIIVAHGYSASTFEWNEFKSYCDANADILVSQVLLGGHGRTYEEFKNSTWEDWQEPIMTEYNALRAKGYTNINFAGSSTGCPLVMDLIKKGEIGDNGLKHIFMIDPIVVPSDKLLTLIGLVGPMLGYLETTNTPTEEGNWYHFRPQETLKQLLSLIDKVRNDLQKGYNLPKGTHMKVYKSIKDPSADAVSSVLMYKGLKSSDGSNIDVEMIDSELHVVTRLAGRDQITQEDRDIQKHVFDDMLMILMQ
ncbi:MAG: alpha/beta hydrolase [Prolixibacteraceae bacterium]